MNAGRAAEALLRTNGGRSVLLRMAAPAVAGAQGEELGLATPEFQDVVLGPVAFRKAESTAELLVAASAVEGLLGSLAFDAAEAMFEAAAGIVVDGVVLVIEGCVAMRGEGAVYAYCLALRAPVW